MPDDRSTQELVVGRSAVRWMVVASLVFAASFVAIGWPWLGRQSAAFDEPPMIAAGVRYRQGDLRWNREHPPLVKWLAAWTVLARDPPLTPPAQGDAAQLQWGYGNAWLHGARQHPLALLASARLACLLLGALLIPLLAFTAFQLGGLRAGVVAGVLVVSTPLWLAYSTLVDNDAAPALFLFASSACAHRLVRAQGRTRLAWSAGLALALALALASKHTAIAFPLLILAGGCSETLALGRMRSLGALVAGCVFGQLAALFFAWGLPPRPDLYLEGLRLVGFNHAVDYVYYAYGEPFRGRSYPYFAYALLIKTPWPVWILALLGPLAARLDPDRANAEQSSRALQRVARHALFVLPPLCYLAGVSLFAPLIGVRYALPVLPYTLLAAALGAASLWRHGRLRWLILPLALLQLLAQAQALADGPLPWFNGFPCRTGELDACLDDSNVDWGQALVQLREQRDALAPHAPLRVFYFGSAPLEAYVPNAVTAGGGEVLQPRPGLYAVSLHFLVRFPPESWVHRLEPIAIAGGSYALYDLRSLARAPSSSP